MRLKLRQFVMASIASIGFVAACQLQAQPEWQFKDAERVVAVADIHGAYDAFVRILERADVIDDDGAWSGGTTHLVIVGDVLDRGPDSRLALDLIMRLEPAALASGGRVHMVLGNHEVMNLTGDLRYVSAGEYAAFAADESSQMRDAAFERYREAQSARGGLRADRASFDGQFPAGFFAHRAAFSGDGAYGAWLLGKPLITVVNDVAFVHGGLADAVIRHGAGLNAALTTELNGYVAGLDRLIDAGILEPTDSLYDHPAIIGEYRERAEPDEESDALQDIFDRLTAALQTGDLFSPDGPIWYRGNVSCNRLSERDGLRTALDAIGARSLVVGHTPTPGAVVLSRMDETLLRVDTGMLNGYYNGRASALIIEGGELAVVYEDEAGVSRPVPQPRRVGLRPESLSAYELETVLRSGTLEVLGEFDGTASLVRIVDGNLELAGIFTQAERGGVRPATAAYRLDRLLGLDMVPVTVARDVDGKPGSLQYWPPQAIDEVERRALGQGAEAWCPLGDQLGDMAVFDLLIYNQARTAARIRYSTDNFQLLLVGHDRTFAAERGRPDYLAPVVVELTPAWRDALAALNEERLIAVLGDVLDQRRIRALLVRRDALLEDSQ